MSNGPVPERAEPNSPRAGDPPELAGASTARGIRLPADASHNAPKSLPGTAGEGVLGRTLGDFRIVRCLGRGGMAEVYLAEQTQLKRNVAVKILHKDGASDRRLRRFQTEAMAAASLRHPNIVQVLTIGEQDGIQYIAQEYVPGMNLRELLKSKGPTELALAVRILRQAASALHAAHGAGIVHRDIKPENIMLTPAGEVKIADFGLAQLTQAGARLNLTQDGVALGTPLYMSPEQFQGSRLDPRTDIYSLGVTCYHLLSGAPPFCGETAVSIALQHLNQEPEPLERIRGDLPLRLCRIVHKMMAKNPEKRYQSANSIVADLKRVAAGGGVHNEESAGDAETNVLPPPTDRPRNLAARTLAAIWHAPDWPPARQIATVLTLAAAVSGVSAGVGWVARVPDPLAAPLREAGAGKKERADRQYFHALNLKDNFAAWQAVIDFPVDNGSRRFGNYARQHLATLLLALRRYDEAQALFDELARSGESDSHFRATGLAGQAVLLNLQGECRMSQQVLDKLQSPADRAGPGAAGDAHRAELLFDLLDDRLRQAVVDTIHRNAEKLDRQTSREWDEILGNHESADVSAGSVDGTVWAQ